MITLGTAYLAPLLMIGAPVASGSVPGTLMSVRRGGEREKRRPTGVGRDCDSAMCRSGSSSRRGRLRRLDLRWRAQVVSAASYPTGRAGWSISILNLRDQSQSYGVAAICLAARTRFTYRRTNRVVRPHTTWGAVVQWPAPCSKESCRASRSRELRATSARGGRRRVLAPPASP